MRELHAFDNEAEALHFVSVLRTKSIRAHMEPEDGAWVIWVENDDDRDPSRELLKRFRANPHDEEFRDAEDLAQQLVDDEEFAVRMRQKLQVDLLDRWRGVWWKCWPVTYVMIACCVLLALVTTDFTARERIMGIIPYTCNMEESGIRNAMFIQKPLAVLPAPWGNQAVFGPANLRQTIRSLEIWRLVTPIFLHFHGLHLLFNMMWLRDLGKAIEFVRGSWRFAALVLVTAVISNVAQLLWTDRFGETIPALGGMVLLSRAPAFGGMSGVVFGFIGYAWMKGRTQPQSGIGLSREQLTWSVLWMFLCIGGAFGNVANTVHVTGFLTGMVLGARQYLWVQFIRYWSQFVRRGGEDG